MNPVKTNAVVKRALVIPALHERIDSRVHTKPSEDKRRSYDNDADIIMTIAKKKIKNMIAEEDVPVEV